LFCNKETNKENLARGTKVLEQKERGENLIGGTAILSWNSKHVLEQKTTENLKGGTVNSS
jgi:hypothetical protein